MSHFAPSMHPARQNSAFLPRFKMFDIDDIIARDDADELADFMSSAVCCHSMSNDKQQQAIVRFRNHVIEISKGTAPAVKIDGVDLDVTSHPAITHLLLSLMFSDQPAQSACAANAGGMHDEI